MNKIVELLVMSLCSYLLVWQSMENIQTYLTHPTAQRRSSQSLHSTGFPKIEVCATPGFDFQYLGTMGYTSLSNFGRGQGNYDGQMFYGWSGNDSTSISKLFENASMLKNFSSVVAHHTLFIGTENQTNSVVVRERKFRYPDGKCFDLNINIDENKNVESNLDLKIFFRKFANMTVNIKITDPNREHFISNEFTHNGNKIKKHDEEKAALDIYRVEIHENIEMEEDAEAKCREYERKEGYKNCVERVVSEEFLTEYGCIPPWFTEKTEIMCHKTVNTSAKWDNMSQLIFPTLDRSYFKVTIYLCKVFSIYDVMML